MISILIATRNGASSIGRTLAALTEQVDPGEPFEVIVVDNGSEDHTVQVVEGFREKLPLKMLSEPTPGKNAALNRALAEPLGEKVLFTDDDTLPAPDWLLRMRAAFEAQPDFQMFGGAIRPEWPDGTPPAHVAKVPAGAAFVVTDERPSGPVEAISLWGPNMGIRREVFYAGHRFSEQFGPRGRDYVMGGETEFTCRMAGQGFRAFWVADSRVGHIIRPEQLELAWIHARAVRNGRSMFWFENAAHLRGEVPALRMGRWRVRGVPLWMVQKYLAASLASATARLGGDRATRFARRWRAGYWEGYLGQAFRHARKMRTTVHEPPAEPPTASKG